MNNCNTRIVTMVILLVFVLGLLTGCRQSPLLEQVTYSNDAKKIDLDNNKKSDNNEKENKDTISEKTFEQNGVNDKLDNKNNEQQLGTKVDAPKDASQEGTGGFVSGSGMAITGGAINQVVSDGGVQVDVPQSVANVTTVGEDTQGPHWKLSRIDNRNKYVGEWKNDMFEGQGIYTWDDGDKYTGKWKADMLESQGTYTWSDGDKYIGEWKDDMFEGQGAYTWVSGSTYEGEWKAGAKEGQGTYTWANGDNYTGGWKAGVKEGQGTYTWADGSVYTGEWKYGIREGQGVYHGADGTIYEGLWSSDKLVN